MLRRTKAEVLKGKQKLELEKKEPKGSGDSSDSSESESSSEGDAQKILIKGLMNPFEIVHKRFVTIYFTFAK